MTYSTSTLIINSTGQIALPYHAVLCVVSQPAVNETAFFKKDGEEAYPEGRPTNIVVSALGGLLNFTERYGSAERAAEAYNGFVAAVSAHAPVYRFPADEEYKARLAEIKAKKKHDEETQRPAYAAEVHGE